MIDINNEQIAIIAWYCYRCLSWHDKGICPHENEDTKYKHKPCPNCGHILSKEGRGDEGD